jgi:hypothetical protein
VARYLMPALFASVWLHMSMPGSQTWQPFMTKLRLCTRDSAQATCWRAYLPSSSCTGSNQRVQG